MRVEVRFAMYGSPSRFGYAGARSFAQDTGEARLAFLRKVYGLFLCGIVSATIGANVALYAGDSAVRIAGPGHAVAVPPLVGFFFQHFFVWTGLWIAANFGARAVSSIPGVNVAALVGFTFVSGVYIAPLVFVAGVMAQAGRTMSADPVRDAFVLASIAFTGLTAYVFTTKKDFSFLRGFLAIGAALLLGAALLSYFWGGSVYVLAVSSVGVIVFGMYVLYDTSRIMNADSRMTPAAAAISLYSDAFGLFLYLLQILMQSRRDD